MSGGAKHPRMTLKASALNNRGVHSTPKPPCPLKVEFLQSL